MGSGITRLCDSDVSCFLRRTREIDGAGKVELVCVGGLWRMGGENLHGMGGEQVGIGAIPPRVSAQSIWWMDTAVCRGMVWQRKLCGLVTGKRNVSKASPRLGWYYKAKSVTFTMTVNDSVVVKGCNSPLL